ncbi:UvrD-helicase domain-containing protein [Actinoplanes sp. NPDC089786]|uniref:UvrD-helicase domain-containing protein n=1 Tax=Actinoplanes sp. NPDC089786 TaxID=3155185 RepID=UPI00342976FF
MATRSPPINSASSAHVDALLVRQAMPCSITMPAGTGKTEIIAAMTRLTADVQQRALVLTHTHAGVDALRRRIKRMGVPQGAARVETIASWSHQLVRHYPNLAGVTVPVEPVWADSALYYKGAARVIQARSLQHVLAATYTFAIVDEYQDCTTRQHGLAAAISTAIPVAVFGDPLQAIFGWDDADPLPSWSGEVQSLWPDLRISTHPWRWKDYNADLGQWLLGVRDNFSQRTPIRIGDGTPVRWVPSAEQYRAMVRECRDARVRYPAESIVAIGMWDRDCNGVGSHLNGSYSVMETIEGKDMVDFARIVDQGDAPAVAAATATWGKTCISGISPLIKSEDVRRLEAGKPIAHLLRPGAKAAQELLSSLLTTPGAAAVRAALVAIGQLPGGATYRHDAWRTVLNALRTAEASDQSVAEAVIQHRNRTRATGRQSGRHTVSRPTLIKGLEYDHAIVLDADQHEPSSLYVALTRARTTLTVISKQPELRTQSRQTARGVGRSQEPRADAAVQQLSLI